MSERGVKRRKKGKSFAQKTMKHFKNGSTGKGFRIEDEIFEYFLHVLKVLNQEFESEDDKKAFVDNVFEQLDGNEMTYCCNQVVSRIVDNLLPFASDDRIIKLINAFDENIRIICMDQFASFVLQKLMCTVTERYIKRPTTEVDDDVITTYRTWMLKTFKYALNNVEEFIFDSFANHVMRTVVNCIVGKTQNDIDIVTNQLNEPDFVRLFKDFVDFLLNWTLLTELGSQNVSSGFLQIVIQSIAKVNPKRTKALCRKLSDQFFCKYDNENDDRKKDEQSSVLSVVFNNTPSIRLLETVLSVAPPKIYTQIYANCFLNNLDTLAQHKEANFSVQKLIKYCSEKVEFEAIFDELVNSFHSILNVHHSGVVLHLCEGCVRFKTKQSVFMQYWMKYLECHEPNDLQILVSVSTIFMKTRTQYDENQENNVHLQGSLLVQNMLKFNKPIKVVNSILEMKQNVLISVFCNPKGSHIADAFFDSEFIGEKSREKFIKIFQGCYTSLAVSKHGSRVFDIIWRSANVKSRSVIAAELLENESKLDASPFGRPIVYNLALASYRHNREEWMKAQNKGDKAKKLFADIL